MPSVESVVEALNDPIRSGSHLMKVLRVLLQYEGVDWLTTEEIGQRANIPTSAVGSRIRELRTRGFNIKRSKRYYSGCGPLEWVYRVFFRAP